MLVRVSHLPFGSEFGGFRILVQRELESGNRAEFRPIPCIVGNFKSAWNSVLLSGWARPFLDPLVDIITQ